MTKEQEFYKALRDIFVGVKVEGESGYINLMRIKSRYYEKGVFPKLQKDIEQWGGPHHQDRIGAMLRLDPAILKGSGIKDSTIPLLVNLHSFR